MTIDEIMAIPDWGIKLDELKRDPYKDRKPFQENIDYYNNIHPILKDVTRQDYYVNKKDKRGKVIGRDLVKRSRIVLPIPRQIVSTGDAMTFGEPVNLILNNAKDESNKEAFDILNNVWTSSGFDTFNHKLFKSVSVESRAAELIFVSNIEATSPEERASSIKPMLLCTENGDEIFPHFNDQKTLDALTRVFKKRMVINGTVDDVEITEIYMASGVWQRIGEKGSWALLPMPFETLTVVYYDQFQSEWHWVEPLIDKQELIASQFSDVNKRLGNPSLVIQGKVAKMPEVEADVKVFTTELTQDLNGSAHFGKVDLLESKESNNSIKQEQDKLDDQIYKNTWPDLYKLMDEAATGNISIATMKLKFINAFVKLGEKKPLYMQGLNERISILKQMLYKITGKQSFLDLDVSVEFNSILPDNIGEIIENLGDAINAGIMSRKTGTYSNPQNKGNEQTVWDEIEQENSLEAAKVEDEF